MNATTNTKGTKNIWILTVAASVALPALAGMLLAEGNKERGVVRSELPMSILPDDRRLLPPEQRVSQALFRALHERTVDSFSKSVGFGFSRMAAPAREHIGMEELWTILPPESAGYEVALIGLEKEAAGTVYEVTVLEKGAAQGLGDVTAGLQVAELVQFEIANPSRKVEQSTASDLDREMLDFLERGGKAPMLVDDSGAKVMFYGEIRATQQRCIACHECESGTLLGAFRYVFDVPEEEESDGKVAVR